MKKTLVALALGVIFSAAQAQTVGEISTTGNLVNSTPTATNTTTTWQNVGSWNQGLPCWSPQDSYYGAYCGPQPYFNNGSFNFSWGLTDVYQSVNIAAALPNTGTGLRVTGYNFGFMAKNGNGWDGGALDYLSAYVRFADSTGKTVENYNYNLNFVFDWTQFNFSQNFATPYPTNTLSTATYGFVGADSYGWAGPYGPEVYNISFNLKYDVDPCANNPLYSPTCSGFSEAMAKLTAAPVVPVAEPVATVTATAAEPVTTTEPTVVAIAPVIAAATPTAAVTPTATAAVTVTPTATRSTTNNSTAVAAAMRAVAETQATVATVLTQAQESAAASQAQDNTSVTQDANSQTSGTGSALGTGLTMTFGFQVPGAFVLPGTQLNLGRSTVDTSNTQQTAASTPDMPGLSTSQTANTDIAASETSPTSTRALASMSNPVNTYQEETGPGGANISSVRNVTPPSELAGGPDINALAAGPQGFNSYLTAQLRDAAFYPPREVYRGQKTVDNARALRGLGSDAKHQEMVNQQYGK